MVNESETVIVTYKKIKRPCTLKLILAVQGIGSFFFLSDGWDTSVLYVTVDVIYKGYFSRLAHSVWHSMSATYSVLWIAWIYYSRVSFIAYPYI